MERLISLKKHKKYNAREAAVGYVFAAPWLIGFLFLMVFPLGYLGYLSMTNANIQSLFTEWRGLTNFENIFKDTEFWQQTWHTLIFVFLSVPVNLIFSLFLAMLLHSKVFGVKVYRVMFYLPTLVTIVAVALLWKQILNGESGILNSFLSVFGIKGPAWLSDYFWAIPALVLMGTWSVGGTVIIFLAGLTDVPSSLYEAADIDGAGKVTKFFKITLPTLSPVIFYNLLMALIAGFQTFAQPLLMTGGNYNTKFLGYAIYYTAFTLGRLGYAAAYGWIMLIIVLLFVLIVKFVEKRLIFYND
jgi:multiple sugar transport system permease protein